jgi:predicted enzyme related to lactoylglutathione lyase
MAHPSVRGLTTVTYTSNNHDAAKAWFSKLLDVAPYFDNPGYAEFRIGDHQHELGLIDGKYADYLGGDVVPADGRAGAIVYWHVDDVQAMIDYAVSIGAKLHDPPREFQPGSGFVGASVIDPFGNVLGFMYSPHYLEMLEKRGM